MDPNLISQQPTGIIAWVSTYGQIVFFFAQLVYWLGMIVLLAYAVAQYKRWVNFTLGTGASGKLRTEKADASAKKVSVDEFVE